MFAARLTKGALSCAQAFEYAVQTTQALAPGPAARAPSTAKVANPGTCSSAEFLDHTGGRDQILKVR